MGSDGRNPAEYPAKPFRPVRHQGGERCLRLQEFHPHVSGRVKGVGDEQALRHVLRRERDRNGIPQAGRLRKLRQESIEETEHAETEDDATERVGETRGRDQSLSEGGHFGGLGRHTVERPRACRVDFTLSPHWKLTVGVAGRGE